MENQKVAIVGRPNVGKSTLFNRLVGRRRAIVDKTPGVTRDRIEQPVEWTGRKFTLVDTGGIVDACDNPILLGVLKQIDFVLTESVTILFLLDGREGLVPQDRMVLDILKSYRDRIILVINKVDDELVEINLDTDYFKLGIKEVYKISADRGTGIGDLLDGVVKRLNAAAPSEAEDTESIPVSIIGKPNVGKSTLLNGLCNEERAIVTDIPGTTRDSIDTMIEFKDRKIKIIDTAGIRKQAKIFDQIENLSVLRAKQSIRMAKVVMFMIDGTEGFTSQDLNLLKYIEAEGKGMIIVVNKWDIVDKNHKTFDRLKKVIDERLPLVSHVPMISVSAKNKMRIDRLMPEVIRVYEGLSKRIGTAKLNAALSPVLLKYQPPVVRAGSPKVYYATQQSVDPPGFILFVNNVKFFQESYRRFIHNQLRELYGVDGVPIRLAYRNHKSN